MPKPRSRKPVAIPAFAPVGRGAAGDADHGAPAVTRAAARAWLRAGELLRPRGDLRIAHRRLVDRRSGSPAASAARPDGAGDAPASTFHGATARFVAFG